MMREYFKNESGVTAIEFAFIGGPFFVLLIGLLEIGFKTLQQGALDRLMFDVAMSISRESDAGVSKADYRANLICGRLASAVLQCDKVQFGIEALPNVHNARIRGRHGEVFVNRWNTGCAASVLIIDMVYPMTNIVLDFGIVERIVYNGEPHMRARGVVRREPLLTGSGTHEGGATC